MDVSPSFGRVCWTRWAAGGRCADRCWVPAADARLARVAFSEAAVADFFQGAASSGVALMPRAMASVRVCWSRACPVADVELGQGDVLGVKDVRPAEQPGGLPRDLLQDAVPQQPDPQPAHVVELPLGILPGHLAAACCLVRKRQQLRTQQCRARI